MAAPSRRGSRAATCGRPHSTTALKRKPAMRSGTYTSTIPGTKTVKRRFLIRRNIAGPLDSSLRQIQRMQLYLRPESEPHEHTQQGPSAEQEPPPGAVPQLKPEEQAGCR